jgi:hypothetical protein
LFHYNTTKLITAGGVAMNFAKVVGYVEEEQRRLDREGTYSVFRRFLEIEPPVPHMLSRERPRLLRFYVDDRSPVYTRKKCANLCGTTIGYETKPWRNGKPVIAEIFTGEIPVPL